MAPNDASSWYFPQTFYPNADHIIQFLTSHGKAIARTLGFRTGSQASSSTQLFAAFILSAIIHAGGDAMVDIKHLGASFPFLFLQAVAITVEDAVIAISGRLKIRSSPTISRLFGYLWVFWWFSMTLPSYIDWLVEAGIVGSELFPVSPIRFILRFLHIDISQFFP